MAKEVTPAKNLSIFDRPKLNFGIASKALFGRGYKIALKGSVDDRLIDIAKNNENTVQAGGMIGALEVFKYLGSNEHLKRKAAQCLRTHRENRIAQIQMNGEAKGTYWLDKASSYIRQAQGEA